jgi:enoyl-CoA hydratase/carnithine racemase
MKESDVLYTVEGSVAILFLNRPRNKNAISLEMVRLLRRFFEEAQRDEAVKGIILTGKGDAFCAGGDVKAMAEGKLRSWDMKRFLWEEVHRVILMVEDIDKPLLAAVNGDATGAGMGFTLMCDLRVCSERARFAESFIKLGLVAGDGDAYFLPRLIGLGQALELLLTGDLITAEQALQLGIATKVVPHDRLLEETRMLMGRIIRNPSPAVRMMKRAVYQAQTSSLRNHLDYISSQLSLLSETEDHLEAARAFMEKRKPVFKGR